MIGCLHFSQIVARRGQFRRKEKQLPAMRRPSVGIDIVDKVMTVAPVKTGRERRGTPASRPASDGVTAGAATPVYRYRDQASGPDREDTPGPG